MRIVGTGFLLLAIGCSSAPDAPGDPAQDERRLGMPKLPGAPPSSGPVVPISGASATVEFLNIEGGCWALKIGGELRQPVNLPAEFRQDGLAVSVVIEPVENMASICMIGPIVRIVTISRR
jgi:hypothetical protein